MTRNDFLKNGLLASGTVILPFTEQIPFSNNLIINPINKLADDNGMLIHNPLPYAKNALEPFMDEETLYLHPTFHHGNAVKAANDYNKKYKQLVNWVIMKILITGRKRCLCNR
jgi:superoxide dismutase, Fe-Mn family